MYGAEFAFDGYFSEVNVDDASLTTITTHTGAFYAGMGSSADDRNALGVGGTFLYTIDPTSGRPLTTRTITGAQRIFNISFAPNGLLYGFFNGNLYSIDPQTAAATFIGFSDLTIAGVRFRAGYCMAAGDPFNIDPNTGAAVELAVLCVDPRLPHRHGFCS